MSYSSSDFFQDVVNHCVELELFTEEEADSAPPAALAHAVSVVITQAAETEGSVMLRQLYAFDIEEPV